MRRLPFAFLLFIVLCIPVVSQAAYNTAFGYRLGLGMSGMSGDGAPENAASAFAGAPVGLFIELSLNPQISIMSEISWHKYSITSETDTFYEEKYYYYFDYLQFPFIMNFKLSRGDIQPKIFAGGYFAPTLGADYSMVGSMTHYDISDETNGSNFGFILGFGMDVVPDWRPEFVRGFHISLDVRRTMGMSSVFSDDYAEAKLSSTLFMLSLGWAFGEM